MYPVFVSSRFYDVEPSLENFWRGVILFGLNSASYKFALGKSLLELAERDNELINLEDLAERFSTHVAAHIKVNPKQSTRNQPVKFFELCEQFNREEIDKSKLVDYTVKNAFNDVIDRFHTINGKEIPKRFYMDERKGKTRGGIRLTKHIHELTNSLPAENLGPEVEARWRLVETAWELNISRRLISVKHDLDTEQLFVEEANRRFNVTSSRDALNGYQKGKCFYFFDYISVKSGSPFVAHVDHFFPHKLKHPGIGYNLDGVWNLVLACAECNGMAEKGAKVPTTKQQDRLYVRNEYLIGSNHPLKETLILQTGKNAAERAAFMQSVRNEANPGVHHTWEPAPKADPTF